MILKEANTKLEAFRLSMHTARHTLDNALDNYLLQEARIDNWLYLTMPWPEHPMSGKPHIWRRGLGIWFKCGGEILSPKCKIFIEVVPLGKPFAGPL